MGLAPLDLALVGAAFAFAFSMGAHYTGACMGMPRAAGALRTGPALWLMAPLTLLGAALASGPVVETVGHGLLATPRVSVELGLVIVLSALGLTSLFNVLRVPTSTIQILVFSAAGAGLASGLPIAWGTIGALALLWLAAPLAAFGLGYGAVRIWDLRAPTPTSPGPLARSLAGALVAVGAAASFAMGANDVANASGAFVMTGLFDARLAAVVGGVGLALGVLTWGRPLLERVAFGFVRLDARTAVAAQLAQAVVVLGYVGFGYFTSMNQALLGAMLGAGFARSRAGPRPIVRPAVRDLAVAWSVGPPSALVLGIALVEVLKFV